MAVRGRFLLFVSLCSLFVSSSGFTVEVTHMEDNIPVQTAEFVLVDEERPPFEALEQAETLLDSGIRSSNYRVKRATDAVSGEICISGSDVTRKTAMFVEKNSEFKLPCHPCNASAEDRFRSMQWVKLDYTPNADGLYYIHEVVPGMDSDAKKNRISLTLDHTLVVKNTNKADMGNYFCKLSEQNSFINKHMTWPDIQAFIVNELDMYYFYHIDVIDLNDHEYIDVSYTSAVSPRGPKQVSALNVEVITQWQPWSACTVCDVEGTRKRIGLCTVRKYDKRYTIPDNYLNHVLSFGEDGLPCQSELLTEYSEEKLPLRPNEIQMDRCNVPCPASRRKRANAPTELPTTDYKKRLRRRK